MRLIYQPPGLSLEEFSNEIDHLLSVISKKSKEILLIGDFNVDLFKAGEHKATTDFYNCLFAHHLLPIITKPTRITCHASTLIDKIFFYKCLAANKSVFHNSS